MTNEERIAEMVRRAEAAKAEALLPINRRPCAKCRWVARPETFKSLHEGEGCSNPIARLGRVADRGNPWNNRVRSEEGLCGPDGLLWEETGFARFLRLFGW